MSRTFACSAEHAWAVVVGAGLPRWLGVDAIGDERGATYEADDGTTGEVRSHRPLDRIRLTWRPVGWDHDSTLQVALSGGATGGTVVRFHQERLAGPDEREAMRTHWQGVLDALAPLLDPDE